MVVWALAALGVGVNRGDWNTDGVQGPSVPLAMGAPTWNGRTQHIKLPFGLTLAQSTQLASLQVPEGSDR